MSTMILSIMYCFYCDKNIDTDWDIHFDEDGNCEKENDEKELKSFKKLMPYL